MEIDQARYHGWQGRFVTPWMACGAIVRVALVQVFRNKAYWLLLSLGALRFMAFWSIIYAVTQLALPAEATNAISEAVWLQRESATPRKTTATSASSKART